MHINFCWAGAEVSQSSSLLSSWGRMGILWMVGLCNHAEHLDCQRDATTEELLSSYSTCCPEQKQDYSLSLMQLLFNPNNKNRELVTADRKIPIEVGFCHTM